jgi:aldehyde dehydrogenase (NAD+)
MPLTAPRLSPDAVDLAAGPSTYVDGAWVDSDGTRLDAVDPSTGLVVGATTTTGPVDVERAVAAARAAFDDGPWSTSTPRTRSALLRRLAEEVERHQEAFAEIGTLEVGTPLTLSRAMHAASPAAFFHWYADVALRGPMGGYEEGLGVQGAPAPAVSTLYREPIGVVAAITAYNSPLLITAFKVGAALAAGCTVVLMPSPSTVSVAVAFLRCVEAAGFPPGVVNLVTGGPDVGQALTTAPGVDLVTFTGSVGVGRSVLRQATDSLKRVVLELGGKSPNLVLPSADLERVVPASITRYTRNTGQACGATTRTIVPRALYDEYAQRAQTFMAGLVVGDPWQPETDLGPLVSERHRASVLGYVERALDGGAVVEAGDVAAGPDRGWFMGPVLLGAVSHHAEIAQEELFGPVGVLLPYDTLDEGIAICNSTRFGLNANVWGAPIDALPVSRRLKAGTVTINGGGLDRPEAPWPGVGESGFGVDRGMDGFQEFFRLRHVQLAL